MLTENISTSSLTFLLNCFLAKLPQEIIVEIYPHLSTLKSYNLSESNLLSDQFNNNANSKFFDASIGEIINIVVSYDMGRILRHAIENVNRQNFCGSAKAMKPDVAPELCNDIIKRRRLVIKNATVDSKIDHNFLQSKRSCYTTPRRNVFEPRYISEIRTPDFGSPRRTKRILSFVRDNDMKKSKMIEALREKNRKLQKRICSFEEIVKHFKKKNMVTDGTGDALLLSQDYLEIFFSAIACRGGFNNNPNAFQFRSAYKRLLIRHELREFENGNCLFDGIDILHDILDKHRTQLCKYVIELYLNTRLHYEAKKMSEKNVSIRQKYTKLVLFKHQ
ncbi:hypothetical protein PV328_010398 [Microctonus aethiopoides]|uniref:Transposable element P transposase-like RNase H C-terminal domain-containing protein n=1 Tax=Microctonus aethiopoides TaxID=144406 RepID=A0AA39FHY8_9HYME|nr:hypothetical protein PV328_010398 [Microctonus aethiopoides]